MLRQIGVEAVQVRLPERPRGLAGLILPGGESTAMRKLIDRWGLRQPIRDLARKRGADLRHVRRHDPARRTRSPTAMRRSCRCSTSASSATPSVASWTASSRTSTCPSSATGRSTRVFIRAPDRRACRADVDVLASSTTAASWRCARATSWPRPSIPSWRARRGSTASSRPWPPNMPSPARARPATTTRVRRRAE